MLVDRNGHAIFYAVHLNEDYEQVIDKLHLRNNALNLAKVSPSEQFPRGTVEIKTAWQITLPNEDTSHYFTTQAIVAKLKNDPALDVVVDPTQAGKAETVKLIGIHIVFVMQDHSEFIWATFEHEDNAPNLAANGDPNSNDPVDATRDWSFYVKGAAAKISNHRPGQAGIPKLKLDEVSQTLTPSVSVFRQFEQGGETDAHKNAIDEINDSVHGHLGNDSKLTVWQHYILIGASWLNRPELFKDGHNFETDDVVTPVDPVLGGVLGGDVKLSDSVIETFTQNAPISLPPTTPPPLHRGIACFGCHTTEEQILPTGDKLPAYSDSL